MPHTFELRVYYEDTDLAGIVYYANYLKFIERGRSEWVRDCGVDQVQLKADLGLVFVVRRVEADYLSPAKFDDPLTVETSLQKLMGASMIVDQTVRRDTQVLFRARVTLAVLQPDGRPVRLPADIRRKIAPEKM